MPQGVSGHSSTFRGRRTDGTRFHLALPSRFWRPALEKEAFGACSGDELGSTAMQSHVKAGEQLEVEL